MSTNPLTCQELTELTTGLHRLARNLWWTWDQEAQEIFAELSPRCWQNLYHNAVAILREVSDYELRVRLQDRPFAERVREVLRAFKAYMGDGATWGHHHASSLRPHPVAYFWLSGGLSSFLDNAPTYLVFFQLAGGDPQHLMNAGAAILTAISAGSVFMGANTYIGNAPNFMVYAIAQERGIKMPSFFGYMAWSIAVLAPVFALVTYVFVVQP